MSYLMSISPSSTSAKSEYIYTTKTYTVKENRKWFAQNRVSIKGDPVPEDLFEEVKQEIYAMND